MAKYIKKTEKRNLANTRENQNKLLNALIQNNYKLALSCKKAGVSQGSYYIWMKNDKEFKAVIDRYREQEIDNIEDAFRDLVDERNPQAVIFGLKTRGKNRGYVERTEIAHFGASEIKIIMEEGSNERVVDAEVKDDE